MSNLLGEQLKSFRQERGMTLRDVSERAEVISSTGILRIEKGQREPKLATLYGLAKALGIVITIDPEGIWLNYAHGFGEEKGEHLG